jgi:ABC-type histidine transport system ATPase subunit
MPDKPADLEPVIGGSSISSAAAGRSTVIDVPPIAISAHDIRKAYGPVTVLNGVSISACKGEVISIIGASGSGKSTFLRCLNLLELPDRGEITVGAERVSIGGNGARPARPDKKCVERLRRRLAMVFQSFNLWHHRTVLGNVIEAPIHVHGRPRAEAVEEARVLLAKVGLSHRIDAYPSQLSGGEQQRAAIARALAVNPDVILMDEPTSALDPELVGEVLGVIRALAQEGRTMLLVTHEIGFAYHYASRVVFLADGVIHEAGTPDEVLKHPKQARTQAFLASHNEFTF